MLKEGLRWEPTSCYLLQAYGALQERRGMVDEALDLYATALRAIRATLQLGWRAACYSSVGGSGMRQRRAC